MSEFLQYFETELDDLRRALGEFERRHPQKAKALRISAGRSADPDVQRLADSLALVSARLNKRLDDAVPELSLDLLRMICPGFLLGAPSYCPVVMQSGAEQFADSQKVARGTELAFADDDGATATYTVARDVRLWPIRVAGARVDFAPFSFQTPPGVRGAEAAVVIDIEALDEGAALGELGIDSIEFYLPAGSGRRRGLCAALGGNVLALSAGARADRSGTRLDPAAFAPVLATRPAPFLPSTLTETPGLERLRDFLCYPDKGYFFALSGLGPALAGIESGPAQIRIFVGNRAVADLAALQPGDIRTNVLPCINCFTDRSLPTRYNYARDTVPVAPSRDDARSVEILRIERVQQLLPDGELDLPLISTPQRRLRNAAPVWQERFAVGAMDPARRDIGFSVTDRTREAPEALDFVAELLCSNGPAGAAPRPGQAAHFSGELAEVPFVALDEPTVAVPMETDARRRWDLLSMLNGNYTTVFEASDPAASLRENLHLCAPAGFADAAEAIWEVRLTQSIAPVTVGKRMLLAAGTLVEVVLDIEALPYPAAIFGYVLNDFLSSFLSYDRFIQLSVRERGRDTPLKVFPKRHGSQTCA